MAEAREDFSDKQHLECPVCFQPYNTLTHKPKILPCGHSFCLECLGKITGSKNSVTCPKDRTKFIIPSGSVENFPNNFTVMEILANLCDDCGGQPKQKVCLEEHCSMSLCDGCRENHHQSFHSALRSALMDLKQETTMSEDDSDMAQMEENAEAAIAEVTKLCDELKHNLIAEIKMLKDKSIESYFEWNVAACTTAAECRMNGQKLLSQIGPLYKAQTSDIVMTEAHRHITDIKIKLAKKKESKPALVEFKMETMKNEFDAFLLKLHQIINPLTEITTGDSLMIQDQASGGQSGSSTQQTEVTTKPDYTRATLHTTYGQSGSPTQQTEVTTKPDYTRTTLHATYGQSGSSTQQTEANTKPDYTRATLHATYGKQGSGEGGLSYPRGISVSPVTNQVAVVDPNNHRIHLLTDSLRPVSVFGEEGEGNNQYKFPWDVTITDRGVMLITDSSNHRVQATDSSGLFLYMFGSKGSGQDQLQYPTGITSTHDHLYICDYWNKRVKVTLHDGTYIREFSITGWPSFIEVSEAQDKAVISDKSGNIHMFTLTGHFMRVITTKQPPLNINARGLAVDKHGNLIVADCEGKQLVVLGEEDQLITTIDSDQLQNPWGVALTLSGDIVVCDGILGGKKYVSLIKVPQVNKC